MYIVVADDDSSFREMLAVSLERSGHEVESAADGIELLKLAFKKKPDLIITDLDMPNMTGDLAIAVVNVHPKLREVPVIVMTGSGREGVQNSNLPKDVPLLPKPLDFKKLNNKLRKIKKKKRK